MTDILLFGTAVQEGNVIRLKDDAYCRISVSGNRVVIRFASSLKNFPALEEGESITEANRYPCWYDRFDNDAAAVGFFGWGNLPRDTYGDFVWARRYFRRMLHPLACEADYLAPGIYDYSFTDWFLKMAEEYDFSADIYQSHESPNRPYFPWNVVPLPHIGSRPFHPVHPLLRIGLANYCENVNTPSTDKYLFEGQRMFAERVRNNPRYAAYFASAEIGNVGLPDFDVLADDPEVRKEWVAYLRDRLGWSLAEIGLRHYGDEKKFSSWDEVAVPRLIDFTGRDGDSLFRLNGLAWEAKTQNREGKETDWYSANPNDPVFQTRNKFPLRYRFRVKLNAENFGKRKYLHIQPEAWHNNRFHVKKVFLNGKEQKELTDRSPVWGDEEQCFQLDVPQKGDNLLELEVSGNALAGYIFLSPHGRWLYPEKCRHRNRRYFDILEFSAQIRADHITRIMRNYRIGDLDKGRPQLVMACFAVLDKLLPGMKAHGGFPHDTGMTGVTYAPWTTTYSVLQNIPVSVEPGTWPRNAAQFQRLVTLYLTLGVDSVNFLFAPAQYRNLAAKDSPCWLDANAELVKCIGKLELPADKVGVLRSIRNAARFRFKAPWTFDVSRGAVQSTGRRPQVVDLEDVIAGRADQFPVLFDAGSETLTDRELEGLKKYVEQGGIFIATHHTGRHAVETADAWPISKLTGLMPEKYISATEPLTFAEDQSLWPELQGKTLTASGLALNLLPGNNDVKVIACRRNSGKIAAAERRIGKGRIILLGSPFYFNSKDNNGSWRSDKNSNDLLGRLFDSLKVPRISRVVPENQQIFAEKRRSKNGLYDVYFVSRVHSAEDKARTYQVTFFNSNPDRLMEISASGYPERQVRRNADGSFTIPGLELEPMQCRIFVAPAENPERAPLLWLESLARRWGVLEPLDSEKSDPVSKPSKWIIPLVDGWMAEQPGTGVRKNVKLGTFDVMGLDSAHTVYFRKTVKLPESWKNRRIELLFDSPARFFTGVFPKGSLRINGRKLLMNFNLEFNDLATPVTVPSDGILNLQLRVDGAENWEKASRRPAGVSGMFYLLANPKPLHAMEIAEWTAAESLGRTKTEKPGTEMKILYLEHRFRIPENWKRKNIFFELDYPHGIFGWLEVNGRVLNMPSGGGAPFRQILLDGLLKPGNEENVLRWNPHFLMPQGRNVVIPHGRIALWPDRPYAPGEK